VRKKFALRSSFRTGHRGRVQSSAAARTRSHSRRAAVLPWPAFHCTCADSIADAEPYSGTSVADPYPMVVMPNPMAMIPMVMMVVIGECWCRYG
jgi:hypothetical protein